MATEFLQEQRLARTGDRAIPTLASMCLNSCFRQSLRTEWSVKLNQHGDFVSFAGPREAYVDQDVVEKYSVHAQVDGGHLNVG